MGLRRWLRGLRPAVDRVMSLPGLRQSDQRLARDAGAYWTQANSRGHGHNSHWRGAGPFVDDARWLAVGRENLAIWHRFARMMEIDPRVGVVAEWGCGGGANAVHFGREAGRYYGIEISQASLDECARQMQAEGLSNFHPVLIDPELPATAAERVAEPVDLLTCFYVFELLPSCAYGRAILETAARMLRPGGAAVIQIKYATLDPRTRPRRWGYRLGLSNMTTYAIDEFWKLCAGCGLRPEGLYLQPEQPLVDDVRYAYYALRKV